MEVKKILLLCPCVFTRIGIVRLLEIYFPVSQVNMALYPEKLDGKDNLLAISSNADIIILALSGFYYNAIELLDLISHRIPIHHPDSKLIILSDDKCFEVLKRYLKEESNVGAILDASVPVEEIRREISKMSLSESTSKFKVACVLSIRELTVLKKILKGKSISQIAKDLSLSYKTVSHYKRTAMSKLGTRTIHSLLGPQ